MTERQLLEESWKQLVEKLNKRFESDLDLQGIIFLIGLQELGLGFKKYKKDEKVNIMHIAICSLLEPYGYYEFEGKDQDGWPHYKTKENLPFLKPGEQVELMKRSILDYFDKEGEI
jgi:hypothetical protein